MESHCSVVAETGECRKMNHKKHQHQFSCRQGSCGDSSFLSQRSFTI